MLISRKKKLADLISTEISLDRNFYKQLSKKAKKFVKQEFALDFNKKYTIQEIVNYYDIETETWELLSISFKEIPNKLYAAGYFLRYKD